MDKKMLPTRYTETDLQNARTKGQVVGWIQGGLGTIGALLVLRLVGLVPTLVVIGVVAFVAIKLFSSRK